MSVRGRPYIALDIEALASIVDNADEASLIGAVAHELSHRNSRAAKRLLAKIKGSYSSNPIQAEPASQPNPQNGIAPDGNARPSRRSQGRKRFEHPPTDEQTLAIDAFMSGESLKISAFAGAGKTSTLKYMANERAGRGLYLAFNKAIAAEARQSFPNDVDCRTTHSIAFRSILASGGFNKNQMTTSLNSKQLSEALELESFKLGKRASLTGIQQAYLFRKTVERFCQSEDDKLLPKHVFLSGPLRAMKEENRDRAIRWVAEQSDAIWQQMSNSENPMPLGHDGYLKLWSLSKPLLAAEYILLDEAQDTNGCVLSVLRDQSSQIIYVGDRHQQIYAWRGAVNAMEQMETQLESYLTKSFRFGSKIAGAASEVLVALGETKPLRGNERVHSEIMNSGPVNTVLARTNATVMGEVMEAMSAQLAPHIVGGTQELKIMVGDVFNLQNGEPARHPDFFGFEDWNEVVDFAESEEGEELKMFVGLVQRHGPSALWAAIMSCADDESQADIILSTAHKAKGCEWDAVRIAEDFSSVVDESGQISESEGRLFYVAITRAKTKLVIDPVLLRSYQSASYGLKENVIPRRSARRPRRMSAREYYGI